MSALAGSSAAPGPLDEILRRAGAVFTGHDGRTVAVNYGSAAGELAVCVRSVGLVDRSELTMLELAAAPAQLRHLIVRLTGQTVAAGGALHAHGAWWCGAAADRVIALSETSTGARLRERLASQAQARHHVSLKVRDRSQEWAAIELIGAATSELLAALGAYGETRDPRRVAPFTAGAIRGVELMWLLESARCALALVPRAQSGTVWRALEEQGRPFGISCVGREAASRYRLIERSAALAH